MILRGNQRLFTSEEASHYYWPDGRSCHSVPYADKTRAGEERKATIKDAKKLGLLPSVTTIMKCLDKPMVNDWRCEMAVLAALTLERNPNESLDAFAKRAATDSDRPRSSAADKGHAIHRAAEDFAIQFKIDGLGIIPCTTSPIYPHMWKFYEWWKENISQVYSAEAVVVNRSLGYAGTRDLLAEHKDHGLCVIDFKSQKFANGKANFYDDFCLQLTAYDMADFDEERDTSLLSVAMSYNDPLPPVEHLWSPEDRSRCMRAWPNLVNFWKAWKGFTE